MDFLKIIVTFNNIKTYLKCSQAENRGSPVTWSVKIFPDMFLVVKKEIEVVDFAFYNHIKSNMEDASVGT